MPPLAFNPPPSQWDHGDTHWSRDEIVRLLRPAQLSGSVTRIHPFNPVLRHGWARGIGCGVFWGKFMLAGTPLTFEPLAIIATCVSPDMAVRVALLLNAELARRS